MSPRLGTIGTTVMRLFSACVDSSAWRYTCRYTSRAVSSPNANSTNAAAASSRARKRLSSRSTFFSSVMGPLQRPVLVGVGRSPLRREQHPGDRGPQQRLEDRRHQQLPAGQHAAGDDAHDERHRMRGAEQRQDLHRLRPHGEPAQPAVDGDGKEAEQRVGERMLAEDGAVVHVHHQAEQESQSHADAARLVHVPEHEHQGQEVGHRRVAAQRHEVHRERDEQREPHEDRIDRQQQLVGAAREDHFLPPFFGLAGRASSTCGSGRGGSCRLSGCSTSTWRTPSGEAVGASITLAKPVSTFRSTDVTRATGRPGGYTPSTPEVCSMSPTCTSALPAMKRSSMPTPALPKAALRSWLRESSTGMAASLSVSSVTSEYSGYTRVTCPSTPASLTTGEASAMPWVVPRSMTTLRENGSDAS